MTDGPPSTLCLVPRQHTEGCTAWRVWWPLRRLEGRMRCGWAYNDSRGLGRHMVGYDLIQYQRLAWDDETSAADYMNAWRRLGKVTIQECDDDIWLAREEQKSHAEMGIDQRDRTFLDNRASTRLYDGLVVSTERLRSIVAGFAPELPVEVVGNYIDLDLWRSRLAPYPRLPKLSGVVTVGWAGGNRRSADLALVAEAWRRLAVSRPAVHFVVQGYLDPVLALAVPERRLHVLEWLPVSAEGSAKSGRPFYGVGLKNVDVMCCAVSDSLFNAAKTPIKWFEATAAGAACVVSEPLYGPVVEHGSTGFVATSADDWFAYLDRLVGDATLRRRVNAAARLRVAARHSLAENVWRWPAAWARLYAAGRERQRAPRVLVAGWRAA